MNHFSVLLVDDDKRNVLDLAKAEFQSVSEIRLETATDKRAADKLVKAQFFHLALVDPRLDATDDNKLDGLLVLEKLKQIRPSCERIILTQLSRNEAEDAESITTQLHPIDGAAQGLLLKADLVNNFHKLIDSRKQRWLRNALKITGAPLVADKLREVFDRWHRKTTSAITEDEIDFLVSRVFGQGEQWNLGDEGLGIGTVELELIPHQGFSLAAVAKATCYSSKGNPGILCVLKFATREYVEQELVRYSQYVRYRVVVHHRVELLNWAFADNLGVLCYNFASITSLSDLFLKDDPGFIVALDDLFSSSKKSWYVDRGEVRLGGHFHKNYGVDVLRVQEIIRRIAHELERQFGGFRRQHQLVVCGAALNFPNEVLHKAVFMQLSPSCVVHGDLHCDNILVGCGHVPMLIDYYSIANGPRCIDFATIESSVRLLSLLRPDEHGKFDADMRLDTEVIPEILGLGPTESSVWSTVWHGDNTPGTGSKNPPWSSASIRLGALARQNAIDPSLSEEEYAATCLMWAMRLFKVTDMPFRILTRLLVWMSCLVESLKAAR